MLDNRNKFPHVALDLLKSVVLSRLSTFSTWFETLDLF